MFKYIDVIEELKRSEYKVLLISSYGADLNFFEKLILKDIRDNGITYIGAFIDSIFVDNLSYNKVIDLGRKYVVRPIDISGAFHPKVFLLLDENSAKLIIGSGNLSPGGLITNIEFFKCYEYDRDNEENLYFIKKSYDMFKRFQQFFPSQMLREIFNKTKDYTYLDKEANEKENVWYIHNIDESIYEQISGFLDNKIKSIDIMTPYFDRNLSVIKKLNSDFQPKEINIYLQDRNSNFPLNIALSNNVFCHKISYKKYFKRYHGKLFSFNYKDYSFLLYGSANCSEAALMKSLKNDGNAEVVLLEKAENNYFTNVVQKEFDIEDIDNSFTVLNQEYNFHSEKKRACFIEAIKKDDKFEVYLSSNEVIIKVILNSFTGKIIKEDDLIKVIWDKDLKFFSPVFCLKIEFQGGYEQNLTGWFNDKEELLRKQAQYSKYIYSKLEDEDIDLSAADQVIELFENLMRDLVLNEDDLLSNETSLNETFRLQKRHELSGREEVSISKNIEDYYVEDYHKNASVYGSIHSIDVLTNLINRLLSPFKFFDKNKESKHKKIATEIFQPKVFMDKDMSYKLEKKIKRFIKKFNQGIESDIYINQVSQEIYLKNLLIYSGFLWNFKVINNDLINNKRKVDENALNFIDDKYIIDNLMKVVKSTINFCKKNTIEEFEDLNLLIGQILTVILAKHFSIKRDSNEVKIARAKKKELKKLLEDIHNNLAPIREEYLKYLRLGKKYLGSLQITKDISEDELINNFEELFSFHTLKKFKEKLPERKNMQIFVSESNPEVIIKFKGKKIELTLILIIFKDLVSVIDWENKNKYIITIKFVNNSNKLQQKFIYDKKNKTLIKKYFYKNGNVFSQNKYNVSLYKLIECCEKYKEEILTQGFSGIRTE